MRIQAVKAATTLRDLGMAEGQSCAGVDDFCTEVKQNLDLKVANVWSELSGSIGDLGTFVPLLLTLAFVNGVDLGTTLIFTGFYNIVTGVVFGIPMPVQPMKYIFAAAIADDPMTVSQIMAAGLCTALVLFVFGVTGLMNIATRLVPTPVIRGFQLSQGIAFGITAVKYIVHKQDLTTGVELGPREMLGADGILLALSALAFVVLVSGPGDDMVQQNADSSKTQTQGIGEEGSVHGASLTQSLLFSREVLNSVPEEDVEEGSNKEFDVEPRSRRIVIPSALIVFLIGIVLALLRDPTALRNIQLGPSLPSVVTISREDWKIGFLRGAVAQIPLSLISTVVAVTKLSHGLFPQKTNVTATSISTLVGAYNLVGCWFGTVPVECGAGGLAAQFRFGARDGYAVMMLGSAKLFLGLVLGSSLLRLLAHFPIGLLGVILLMAGSELAMFCRDQTTRLDAFVMVICATGALSGLSAPLGFVLGFAAYLLLKLRQAILSSSYLK